MQVVSDWLVLHAAKNGRFQPQIVFGHIEENENIKL